MAKEICPNCNFRMTERVSFCPDCSRPTAHATEAELLDWDLRQWRNHIDRSAAVSGSGAASVTLRSAPARRAPAPDLRVVVTRDEPIAPEVARARPRRRRTLRLPQIAKPKLKASALRRSEPQERDRVIVLDADQSFVYTACTSCERADWIVRTTRNEDGTYNYWCARCSRSFKTDARMRHAWKPFLASGSVIGALASLSILLR